MKATGAHWAQIDTDIIELDRALALIDEEIGATKFLAVLAFNNSPHNLLGDEGDCPCVGYFTPEQSRDLNESLRECAAAIEHRLAGDDGAQSVYYAFEIGAQEAARRGYALAVLHDA